MPAVASSAQPDHQALPLLSKTLEPSESAHTRAALVLQASARFFLVRRALRGWIPATDPDQLEVDVVRSEPRSRTRSRTWIFDSNSARSTHRDISTDVSAHVVSAKIGPADGQQRVALYMTHCSTPPDLEQSGVFSVASSVSSSIGVEWEVCHRFSEWHELHLQLIALPEREFREKLVAAFPPRLGGCLSRFGPVVSARQRALDNYLALALDVSHEVGSVPDALREFLSKVPAL